MRHFVVGLFVLAGCHAAPTSRRDPVGDGATLGGNAAWMAMVRDRSKRAQVAPPVSLTPTDGTELALRQLGADIQIRGPIAHTELRFTFHNSESRIREGRFAIAIPPDAAVSRFAMKVDGVWREARVVARAKGRAVYETYLHRRVDPALLERDADNRFSARVFPIPAGADKELIIAYDHVVGPSAPYALALHGLPAVPITIAIDQDGDVQQRVSSDAPADLVLGVAPGDVAVASDAAFVARIDDVAEARPVALDRVLLLVDTSASRASLVDRQATAVGRLVDTLPGDAEVVVAVFDHEVREVYRGRAREAHGVAEAVRGHGALGASRLAAALGYAATAGLSRVVVIGDVVATLGERDPARLASIVAGSAITRLDVVQLGQAIDRDAARAVVAAGRDPGAILDGHDLDRVARQLVHALAPERPIAVAGATASWPATTRGVAPGEPIFVYGVYDRGAARSLAVTIGDRAVELATQDVGPTGVRRVVASAELAALGEALAATTDPEAGARLRAEIERVSLAHGLVSSQTSLLTLESDADEQRMLGPRTDQPAQAVAAQAEPSQGDAQLSDEELARLAEEESKTEVITVTGSLIERRSNATPSPVSVLDREALDGMALRDGHGPAWRWGVASDQRPSIILDRDRTQHLPDAPPAPEPAPEPPVREPTVYDSPYVGALRDVMTAIARHDLDAALARALRARDEAPDDIAAILALGEALEARGDRALAARAYGSIIDLFPNRDELVRAAGERFDRIGGPARELAVDAYQRAVAERPDRAVSYRRLGYALARVGRWTEAVDALVDALPRSARPSVIRIVREDIGLLAAAGISADPAQAAALQARLDKLAIWRPATPSLRFVLSWETDANDVDLHVRDRHGDEAYYGRRKLPSGGDLLDDLTDGFGPEMLSIDAPDAFPYQLAAHYYRRGPEGLGLGVIQIIRDDGHGGLTIEDRPFALQVDNAMIDVGVVNR